MFLVGIPHNVQAARTAQRHLNAIYVSDGQDARFFRWALGWVPWAIEHGRNPMFTDRVFAPDGVSLTWTAVIPGPAVVVWPVTRAFGSPSPTTC